MKSSLILAVVLSSLFAVGTASAAAGGYSLADRHVKAGVKCDSCHGKNMAVKAPGIAQCATCHDPMKMAEKTKEMKPANPHNSPHWETNLDCTLCHAGHAQPQNYCAQCHAFNFKVP